MKKVSVVVLKIVCKYVIPLILAWLEGDSHIVENLFF